MLGEGSTYLHIEIIPAASREEVAEALTWEQGRAILEAEQELDTTELCTRTAPDGTIRAMINSI